MITTTMDTSIRKIHDRLEAGEPTLLLGRRSVELPERLTARVDCAAQVRPLGAMFELQRKLHRIIEQARGAPTRDDMHHDHRIHRRDDDEPFGSPLLDLVQRAERVARDRVVVVVESIDVADEQSLRVIAGMLDQQGPGRLALLLTSAEAELSGEDAARIMRLLSEGWGPDAIVRLEAPADIEPAVPAASNTGAEPLGYEILRALRAGATIGDTFEADVVAMLLGSDTLTVLELLQMAYDQGAPIRDLGERVFRLPPDYATALRAQILPSLADTWHRGIAAALSADDEQFEDEDLPRPRMPADASARAAEHAAASGQSMQAAERYLMAARDAAKIGGHQRAIELVETALDLLPPTSDSRELRIRALLELGRARWRAAGGAGEGLEHALVPLETAHKLVRSGDAALLRADLLAMTASVSYDIGGAAQYARAIASLEEARQVLIDDGQTLEAARLLNDEAAIRVRLGDLEAAGRLLARSRDVFLRLAESDPVAMLELAQTDHQVARLALRAYRGPEDREALAFGIERARAAEQHFAALGAERERGRAHETLGRLSWLVGDTEGARRFLANARELQLAGGDAVGLARTSAALSELLIGQGKSEEALRALDESIALNMATGSRQGLDYNRRGFEELVSTLSPTQRRTLENDLELLRARLSPPAERRAAVASSGRGPWTTSDRHRLRGDTPHPGAKPMS